MPKVLGRSITGNNADFTFENLRGVFSLAVVQRGTGTDGGLECVLKRPAAIKS